MSIQHYTTAPSKSDEIKSHRQGFSIVSGLETPIAEVAFPFVVLLSAMTWPSLETAAGHAKPAGSFSKFCAFTPNNPVPTSYNYLRAI
jgi:hypothetical protein